MKHLIWIGLIVLGTITRRFIPTDYQYLYGFIFGSFTLLTAIWKD